MAESGALGRSGAGGSGDAAGAGSSGDAAGALPGATALFKRWIERSAPDTSLPEPEARSVVQAVLDDLRGASHENVQIAGRLWGQAHRSVSEMVGRLSHLRAALVSSGVDDPLRMHQALDRVTAAATEELITRVERVSRTDALTGVGNRRAFDETIQGTLSAASRQGHEVTLVAVDLDGLKKINDSAGHAAGDAALVGLVHAFYEALRDEDTIFRLGGDEFVIVLPFTSVDAAQALMQRVAATDAPSFTWGAAGFPGDGDEASALVGVADRDLYRRRGEDRGFVPAPRRGVLGLGRLEGSRRLARWAWVPAAAVLVVSLVATLVSASSAPNLLANKHPSGTAAPASGRSSAGSKGGAGGSSGEGAPGPGSAPVTSSLGSGLPGAGSGGGTPALTAGFTRAPATAVPGGSSSGHGGTGTGSSTGGGGGGTTPAPPGGGSGNGGLVGSANSLLGSLPLVGSDGLLPVLDQLLVGQPSSAAGAVRADPAPSVSAYSSSASPGRSAAGLFSLLASL